MELDTIQIIGAFVVAIFGREAGARLIRHVRDARDGRAQAEKDRLSELVAARNCAEADRDHQAKWRRITQEYASGLRSKLIELGVPADQIPTPPPEPERRQR